MSFQIFKPSSLLSQYVKQYWAIEDCVPNGNKHIQRIVPNGLMDLIFYLGDRPKVLGKHNDFLERTIISGQLKDYYEVAVTGSLSIFSISFYPHGATTFFNIPLNELYNYQIPLKYLIKDKVVELESSLFEATTFYEKISIVEDFLVGQLKQDYKAYEIRRISKSIGIINQSKGIVDIDYLSSEACLSRKQYERTFLEFIGTTPKQFLKIVRFQNVLHEKHKNKNLCLTELAYDCGYYDQAHMTNDFNTLSGLSPKQFFSECEPYSDYFQ